MQNLYLRKQSSFMHCLRARPAGRSLRGEHKDFVSTESQFQELRRSKPARHKHTLCECRIMRNICLCCSGCTAVAGTTDVHGTSIVFVYMPFLKKIPDIDFKPLCLYDVP